MAPEEIQLRHLEKEMEEIKAALAVEPYNSTLRDRAAKLLEEIRAFQFTLESVEQRSDTEPTSDEPAQKTNNLAGRIIHPALHIERGFSSVGVMTNHGKEYFIFTSDGEKYFAEEVKDSLLVPAMRHPELSNRWRPPRKKLSPFEALALLIHKWSELQWFNDSRSYPTLSLFAAGTYVHNAFDSYPYICLTGEKGSGKTKVLDILQCVAFNALQLVSVTPAVLFRLVNSLRPTVLIDEAETMSDDLRAIVNVGYKKGATVARCIGEDWQPRFFEVFSPKCLASIQGLGDVTEDRAIVLVMAKPPLDDNRRNRSVSPKDPDWSTIRYCFYRLALAQNANNGLAVFIRRR